MEESDRPAGRAAAVTETQFANGKNPQRQWAPDADLAAAFDRINHNHVLRSVGLFPSRGLTER